MNKYDNILEEIFKSKWKKGKREVSFDREEIDEWAKKLGIPPPKNLGDLIYSFRYRKSLPPSIIEAATKGKQWLIRSAGRSRYKLVLVPKFDLTPNPALAVTKVPESTPGIITKYAQSDEQALLAKLRYNRLVDIFTGVTCYSLQNHLRTTVTELGQIETDEIYVGVDKKGSHYVFPVQAKGGRDQLNVVQIEQDFAMCKEKFPALICRPIAAQFMKNEVIAMFEFEEDVDLPRVASEKHYNLVPPDDVSDKDLRQYAVRAD